MVLGPSSLSLSQGSIPTPQEPTLPLPYSPHFCRDLGTEYLTCDCHLRWLLPWARNRSLQLSEHTVCAYPAALHAQALGGLQEAQLRCGEHILSPHTCQGPLCLPPGADALLKGPGWLKAPSALCY